MTENEIRLEIAKLCTRDCMFFPGAFKDIEAAVFPKAAPIDEPEKAEQPISITIDAEFISGHIRRMRDVERRRKS